MDWESAERVQKNDAGEYRALIGGEWIPVDKAQKNESGQFRVMRPATPSKPTEPKAPEKSISQNLIEGAGNLLAGAVRGAGSIGATILLPADMINQKLRGEDFWSMKDNRARRAAIDEGLKLGALGYEADPESAMYKTGKVGTEIAGTLGVGTPLAAAAKSVPVISKYPALIEAIQSAGMRTGMNPAGFLQNAANIGTRALGGGIAGGAGAAYVNPDEAGTGAAIGAGAGVVLPPLASGAAKAGGYLVDALKGRIDNIKAGQVLRQALGGQADEAANLLKSAPENITTAQALEPLNNPLVAKIGEKAAGMRANEFEPIRRAQEAARIARLEGVTPDLERAIAERTAKSEPLYRAAKSAGNVVDTSAAMDRIDDLLARNPANDELVTALSSIKRGLLEPGDSGMLRTNAEQIASAIDGLKAKMASKDNKFILEQLSKIKDDLTAAIPNYGKAQAVFREASKPVNQAQVMREMANTLKGSTGDEQVTQFLRSMDVAEKPFLRRADQTPRFGSIDEILNAEQKSAKDQVVRELMRDRNLRRLASQDKGGLNELIDESAVRMKIPNTLNRPIAYLNKFLGGGEKVFNKAIMENIYKGQLKPADALMQLNELPTSQRNAIMKAIMEGKGLYPIAIGAERKGESQ